MENNGNITITFKVNEKEYWNFKRVCRAERKIPAVLLRGFITKFNEESKKYIDENEALDESELERRLWSWSTCMTKLYAGIQKRKKEKFLIATIFNL